MDHDRDTFSGTSQSSSPPSEAWLFAQQLLGQEIPPLISPGSAARARRAELERLAAHSERHAEELRRLDAFEAEQRRQRASLEWAAGISERAEEKLRALERKEAEEREAWLHAQRCYQKYCMNLIEWNEVDHPRQPAGTSSGGQFAPKGSGSGGGLTGTVLSRNHAIGELSGVVTPATIASSRLAAKLQSAVSLAGDVARAAAAGLITGGKAIVNGSATAVKSAVTLGLSSGQLELIGVTKDDRERGYDSAATIATASGQILIAVGTGGVATALSKGGTIARTASGALTAYDAAGNAVGVVQGSYDAIQNDINLENGLKIAGGALGLAANVKAAREIGRAVSAAELQKVEAYIEKCPRKLTPTTTAANRYEIAHTGPYNYIISGGGDKFEIDGYRSTVILEAKHAGDLKSSPYIPGTSCPPQVRASIMDDTREKLERALVVIRSRETPFKSIEVITNTPESKLLFEGVLKEMGIPGTVRLGL